MYSEQFWLVLVSQEEDPASFDVGWDDQVRVIDSGEITSCWLLFVLTCGGEPFSYFRPWSLLCKIFV